MIVNKQFKAKITVHFIPRDDGGMQAKCDDVPGFLLSGKDRAAVYRDVVPAIEKLVKHNLDIAVRVSVLQHGLYQLEERVQRVPESIPSVQEYLVEAA